MRTKFIAMTHDDGEHRRIECDFTEVLFMVSYDEKGLFLGEGFTLKFSREQFLDFSNQISNSETKQGLVLRNIEFYIPCCPLKIYFGDARLAEQDFAENNQIVKLKFYLEEP